MHQVADAGRKRIAAGDDIDAVIAYFKDRGLGTLETVWATMLTFDIGLGEARGLVEMGPAFDAEYQVHADLRRDLIERLRPVLEAIRTQQQSTAADATTAAQTRTEPGR